jgi:hypothetical protein
MESPSPYAVLNSITNDPAVGDERNFFRVRHDAEGTTYTDAVDVEPGDVLKVAIWFRNAAADNLAGSAATVHGLECQLITTASSQTHAIGATLRGRNVVTVWDGAVIHADVPVNVQYVNGSATFRTNQAEYPLPDSFGSGAWTSVGQTQADGEFPVGWDSEGRGQGTAWLVYEVVVVAAG